MPNKTYNFSPGPAKIPDAVLKKAHEEFLDWHGLGISVMEISHRSPEFIEIARQAEKNLRKLLKVPDNYHICFMHGGAQRQFAMLPLNLLRDKKIASYVQTGSWSKIAVNVARQYATVNLAACTEPNYTTIPDVANWDIADDSAYLHYCDNESIHGVEFPSVPDVGDLPLAVDMSSNILSRPIDISKFAVVYACAQKNIGPAGLTIAIVRDDCVGHALPFTEPMSRYKSYVGNDSMPNTPTTFAWYMAGLCFEWLLEQGGVEAIAKINQRKADKLYQAIDESSLYSNPVDIKYRSRMNVPFDLPDEALTKRFIEEATDNDLLFLKGHRLRGGIRASIYNAMPEAGVDALIAFMRVFEKSV